MDEVNFQRQALFVPMIDESFDPEMEPTNGEEYLMKVIYERSKCPKVVVKNINPKPTQYSRPSYCNVDELVDTSSKSLRPSQEWKRVQLTDFSYLRTKIVTLRTELQTKVPSTELINIFPQKNQSEQWLKFCRDNQPLLSIILQMDHRLLENILEYHSLWLEEEITAEGIDFYGNDCWLGRWIYAIFACLQMPLEPYVHSALRRIAKRCVQLRNDLHADNKKQAKALNLFILLVAEYFRQFDLTEYI